MITWKRLVLKVSNFVLSFNFFTATGENYSNFMKSRGISSSFSTPSNSSDGDFSLHPVSSQLVTGTIIFSNFSKKFSRKKKLFIGLFGSGLGSGSGSGSGSGLGSGSGSGLGFFRNLFSLVFK